MSNGPIQRERDAYKTPRIPKPPKVGDIVALNPPPFGVRLWRVLAIPMAATPNDVADVESTDSTIPMTHTRRRVRDLHATKEKP